MVCRTVYRIKYKGYLIEIDREGNNGPYHTWVNNKLFTVPALNGTDATQHQFITQQEALNAVIKSIGRLNKKTYIINKYGMRYRTFSLTQKEKIKMATKSLTVRSLIQSLITCENLDAPVATKNINDVDDEFNEDNPQHPQEIISVADNTADGGDAVLYFLGDIPTDDED